MCTPLVLADEIFSLRKKLGKVASGNAFLLMGGDCAESFDEFSTNHVLSTFNNILQMAMIITFGGEMPVVNIGRMAGQFAKPRSDLMETCNGVTLPSYRGDIINNRKFSSYSRNHNPNRMLEAYRQSSQTMNMLRSFTSATSKYASISDIHSRNLRFVAKLPLTSRFRSIYKQIDHSVIFLKSLGVDLDNLPVLIQKKDFYTAHECLLLPYEQGLTRIDNTTNTWYDSSAHLLWIGERTRQVDHAHMHFVSGLSNPVGVKISEKCSPNELIKIIEALRSNNCSRGNNINDMIDALPPIVVIVRMGAQKLREHLPHLIRAVQDRYCDSSNSGRNSNVIWCCDPMHANTIQVEAGNAKYKTRPFDRIIDEVNAFFDVHELMGSHAGGIHLEMTGDTAITECIGGYDGVNCDNINSMAVKQGDDVDDHTIAPVQVNQLSNNTTYRTSCDPRLNGNQSLQLAFLIAERMRKAADARRERMLAVMD